MASPERGQQRRELARCRLVTTCRRIAAAQPLPPCRAPQDRQPDPGPGPPVARARAAAASFFPAQASPGLRAARENEGQSRRVAGVSSRSARSSVLGGDAGASHPAAGTETSGARRTRGRARSRRSTRRSPVSVCRACALRRVCGWPRGPQPAELRSARLCVRRDEVDFEMHFGYLRDEL